MAIKDDTDFYNQLRDLVQFGASAQLKRSDAYVTDFYVMGRGTLFDDDGEQRMFFFQLTGDGRLDPVVRMGLLRTATLEAEEDWVSDRYLHEPEADDE